MANALKAILSKAKHMGKTRDFKNLTYSAMEFIVNPMITILITPLLLKMLGAEFYGSWILMGSIIAILSVTNLGVSSSVVKFGSAYLETNDYASFNRVLRFTMALCIAIGSATTLLLYLLGPSLLFLFQNVTGETGEQIVEATRVLGAVVGVKIISSVFAAVCMAHHRYDVLNKTNMLVNVITNLMSVVLVYLGFKLLGLVVLMLLMSVCAAAFQYAIGRRMSPELIYTPRWDREASRTVLGYGMYSWLQVISSVIYTQIDRVIISSTLGPAALGVYSVCMQLAAKLHEVPAAAGAFLFPKFSSLRETGNLEQLKKVYIFANKVVILAVTSLSVPMLLYADSILTIWISPEFAVQAASLLRLLVVGVASGTVAIVAFYYLNGTEYVKLNTGINFGTSAATLLGSLLLVPLLGIPGAAFSRMLGFPIGIGARLFIEIKLMALKWKLLLHTLVPPVCLFILSGLWIYWTGGPSASTLISLLLQLAASGTIVLIVMGVLLFGMEMMSLRFGKLRKREREEAV
ncbi:MULTISPECIES: lipopolysaccharide biosynthesis protein [Paenibacillus]|uniref:lipopolysaccharide biosynthesis protein n=1 Tax=Paenibacillus TaxID=44249 RepID=UPI0022B8A4AC|nr:oligosaccharide flippase family protein [Paenibacillus caseinilyticus]MCZ8519329.1 oligosaccharide flippase family protein [Paenibacillus caseinilyticus]